MLKKYPNELKLVVKHFPLRNHKYAWKAAIAALAASEQDKFWPFHHKLFKNYKSLNDSKIQEIATEIGLEMDKFNRDLKSPEIAALIKRDLENGNQVGVRGTPTIFINGKSVTKRNLKGFSEMIDAELKKDRYGDN